MKQAWSHNESPAELASRKLKIMGGVAVAALAIVALCGVAGGTSGAVAGFALAFTMICIAAFAISVYVWARPVGQVVIEGPSVLDTRSGRRIDLRQPHAFAVLTSQNITKAIFVDSKRGTRNDAWLVYEWVALVLQQNGIELAVLGRSVHASADVGYVGATTLTANRTFAVAPRIAPAPPTPAVHIDMMAFDDFEKALMMARNNAARGF